MKWTELALVTVLALITGGVPAGATITPVQRPDPHGSELEPLPDGLARAKFDKALAYLKQVPKAAQIIDRLEESDADYRVEIVDRGQQGTCAVPDQFDGFSNLVQWDPDLGFEWHGSFHSYHAQSPAISLMHELGHAYHKEIDPYRFFRLLKRRIPDHRWTNLEEKRTILNIENPVAAALGESERFFHADSAFFSSDVYAVVDPTSTRPAREQARFMPVSEETPRVDQSALTETLHRALKQSRRTG